MIASSRFYYPRLGRISCGFQASKGAVAYPARSDTLVFSADERSRVEAVASVLGGEVRQSPRPAGADERWFVVTQARELEVLLPDLSDRTWDAWYELWGAGGLVRRCDGARCLISVDPQTGERREDLPCLCDGLEPGDEHRCRITCRLNVLVPRLAPVVPGIGVWQVVSRGESTYRAIASVLELLRALAQFTPPSRIPLTLRVESRQGRDAQGRPRRWPVLTLQSAAPMAALLAHTPGQAAAAAAPAAAAAVTAPEDSPEDSGEEPELTPEDVLSPGGSASEQVRIPF